MPVGEMQDLLDTMPQVGTLDWIGLRPGRRQALQPVPEADLNEESGLQGDHYRGRSRKRQVTLIQAEHIQAVAKILDKPGIDPGLLRRNLVVSGINLLALKDRRFSIGDLILEGTGHCHPCSRMEENLGAGGYNAMRGHGGLTAKVVKGGTIRLGDEVKLVLAEPTSANK